MADAEPARVAWRSYHDWVLPRRAVQVILGGSLLFLFLGLLLLALGGGLGVGGLIAAGAVLAGIGGCGLLVCLLLCLHAYFVFNVKDEAVQTVDHPWSDDALSSQEIPGYATISKPSSLKSPDSTLRRNGGGVKKVTMAPDVALDADVRAPALRSTASGEGMQFVSATSPNLSLADPASPGYRTLGPYAVIDTSGGSRGVVEVPGVRTSAGSSMESFDQRSYAQQQQYNLIQQQKQQQQLLQRQHLDPDIQHQRQQLELHRQHLLQQQQQQQNQQQQHHQQQQPRQQQHHFRVQPQSQSHHVTYAQVQRPPAVVAQNSPSPSMSSQQSSVFTTGSVGGAGGSLGAGQTASLASNYRIQTSGLQYQSGRPYTEDDDYDNPVERTPMLAQQQFQRSSPASYNPGSTAYNPSPSPYSTTSPSPYSPTSPSPYSATSPSSFSYTAGRTGSLSRFAQEQDPASLPAQHAVMSQQRQAITIPIQLVSSDPPPDLQATSIPIHHSSAPSSFGAGRSGVTTNQHSAATHASSYSSSSNTGRGVSFGSGVKPGEVEVEVEVPEPAPLQYPSERRPMTFEQQSSSKMSIYDNVLFPYSEAEG